MTSSSRGASSLLFVGQDDDGLHAEEECSEIVNLVESVVSVVGENATPDRVLEYLNGHTWAHFACHGVLKPGKPFDSSFKLSNDENLTLFDIVRAQLPKAQFAYLAACHTAEHTERSVHNEVLHLAGGIQFCGIRSVIGTMRNDGPAFAKAFCICIWLRMVVPQRGDSSDLHGLFVLQRRSCDCERGTRCCWRVR